MGNTARSACLAWLLALSLSGCGTATTTYSCQPECPPGATCTPTGCVWGAVDQRTTSPPDMTVSTDCLPACSGATPVCRSGVCVACAVDGDCPLGSLCQTLGALPICVPGCNDDKRCTGGAASSQRCCGHACVDVSSDSSNCGACNAQCGGVHSTASCQSGACAPGTCERGWGDCNGKPGDGCETNLDLDVKNCGACATACGFANASAGCSGACYIASCTFGFGDCDGMPQNGCEQVTLSDVKNCGDCGKVCDQYPHGVVGCLNASCALTGCAAGYADCNGALVDGCEVGVFGDSSNCGVCGNVCGKGLVCKNGACTCPNCNFPNAKSLCINGVCALGKCLAGFGDCNKVAKDGCEQDLTFDPKNCGACGNVCPPNMAYCASGVCTDLNNSALVLYADAFGLTTHTDVTNNIRGTGAFTVVDEFDGKAATPTVDQMIPYGAVLVYSNDNWQNASVLGDNLADYFDMGGQVVIAVFGNCPPTQVLGRFADPNQPYWLIDTQFQEEPNDSLGVVAEPDSPLMKDVMKLSAQQAYRTPGMVLNGGITVASWGGGRPLVVRGSVNGRNTVALNFFPPSSAINFGFVSGDIAPLLRNALLYR
jgi:hypothetical protein